MSGLDNSDSPVLFAHISENYIKAASAILKSELEGKHPFHWDMGLIFHPLSNLFGVAIETSIKGLLVCRDRSVPKSHNLKKLYSLLDDASLTSALISDLQSVPVPRAIMDANPKRSVAELEAFYRQPHFHIEMLNRVYDRPFATRYPVLGGHSLPDPTALHLVSTRIWRVLSVESRTWRLETP